MLLTALASCTTPAEQPTPDTSQPIATDSTLTGTLGSESLPTSSFESSDIYSDLENSLGSDSFTDSESASDIFNETETNSDSDDYTESESNVSSDVATNTDAETTVPDVTIDESILTVFANGAYTVEFIRGDMASQLDINTYTEIRALFKEKTKVATSLKTDFVGVGKEKYDGPAILIGETNYQESIDAYKALKDNQATATLVGNKYVIAFSNSDSAAKIVSTIKGFLNKKASATEIKIDESWNATAKATTSFSENTSFKDSGLTKSAAVNSLGLGTAYDAGQGCKTYVKTGATKAMFTSFCTAVEKAGATKYTGNAIGNNLFATYVTQTQIIHLMFFPNKSEIRTAVDVRGTGSSGYALPGLSTENKYTKKNNSTLTLCEIENSDWPGGLCMIFKLADGRFFVVDSGIGGRDNNGSSSGWIYASLAKYADDPKNIKVAAWLITHVHSDHAGGLYDIVKGTYKKGSSTHKVMPQEAKQWIKIDKIIYNQPATMNGYGDWMKQIIDGFNVKKVVKAHPGQVFFLSDLTLTVYASQDLFVESRSKVSNNNEDSVATMATFNGKKILMLGDTYPLPNKAMAAIYKEQLKADVVQTAHHGYDDTNANLVYEYCKPDIVLWPVAKGEMSRENVKNNNTNRVLKNATYQYAPHGGNLVLDNKWNKSIVSTSEILKLIPTCTCGCGKKSSYVPKA